MENSYGQKVSPSLNLMIKFYKLMGSKIMKRVLIITIALLYNSMYVEAKQIGPRIVHFPENRSMGMLYILDLDKADTSSYDEWEVLCEATGEVAVPAGKALRLNLSKEAGNDLSPLSKLRPDDLVMLFCYGVEISDEQLKHISHLTGLQELYFRDTGILGTGLKYLANLKSLQRLRVDNTHVGDKELAYLSDLPSLKSLNLGNTPTNDAGMIHIAKIASLEKLVLSRGIGDEGLSHLKNLTSLRHFYAGSQSTSDDGLAHLANMINMEVLYLRETQVSDKGLVHLKKMKKLKRLRLFRTNITEKGLVHLVGLKNLELLELPFAVADTGLIHLSQLTLLKSVNINGDAITSKGLATLSKMKSLEQVAVSGTHNTDEIVSQLSGLSGLKSLNIRRGLTDKGLMQLKNIKSLQELRLNGVQVTGKGLEALTEFPSLRVLSFFDMEIPSRECWINLGKLTSLQRLSLNTIRSTITDENIKCLTDLHSLKYLKIFPGFELPTNLTDIALKHISELKALERLTLWGIDITDEGLKHLEKLKSLKWMDLQGCKVTEEGLQQLKKKLPALRWVL